MKQGRQLIALLLAGALLAVGIFAYTCGQATVKTAIPSLRLTKKGAVLRANESAEVDASNADEGFLIVRYMGGKPVKIKAQVTGADGKTYTFDLPADGAAATLPLTQGSGEYAVVVLEQQAGDAYRETFRTSVSAELRSEYLPFLYPNQFVNFGPKSTCVQRANVLAREKSSAELVAAIDAFVVDGLQFDETPRTSGYLPDLDAVLAAKRGICFDYAALMAAMLRSQGIPCKLLVGDAGAVYHAWVSVYLPETGWKRYDPTFASSAQRSEEIMAFIADDTNYAEQLAY